MQQIADHLGLSKFAVSKALSGKGGVSEATKDRVIQAASELGYFGQKNGYIKSQLPLEPHISNREKRSVLVLMPNIRFQTRESLYWGKIMEGISEELEARKLGMIIVSEAQSEHVMHVLNPEGLLGIVGVGQIESATLLEIHRLGLPLVLVDHEDALIPTDTVFANNRDSMLKLCAHLIGLGHQRLHFFGDIEFSRSFRDRWTGYRDALEAAGLDAQDRRDPMLRLQGVERGDYEPEVKAWIARRVSDNRLPTALVCANDSIALRLLGLLRELGIRVPEEVAVTGFDNIDDASRSTPSLTTVDVPKQAIGNRAVKRLIERIDHPGQPFEKILASAELVYRDSSASGGSGQSEQ
ncbi:LacI family transcriptional regulator [Paenibacillus methanolicus]|uniref:LacI family transcriptional regulator n=2 Tax=Paenibacillus methanolicus TaxID=582686 RepID=A0A5S5CBL0_9BACL|nr:LacI family transcriptional regulator [Paenibacillus methanolicus]